MPPTITGYTREQGVHQIDPASMTGTPPVQPDPSTPAVPDETVPPDAASLAASAGTGEPPPDDQDEPEIQSVFTQPGQQRQRPFVTRILRENGALQNRLAALEAQNAVLLEQMQRGAVSPAQPPAQGQTPPPPATNAVPRAEDFNGDMAAYGRALEGYWRRMAGEEAETRIHAALEQQRTHQQQEEQNALQAAVVRVIQAGERLYPDFRQALPVLDAALGPAQLYEPFMRFIAQSPQAVAVMHHLITHPDALQELTDRSMAGASRYLHHLEARLETGANGTAESAPPPRQASPPAPPALPPAIQPLRGGAGALVPPSPAADANAVADQGGSLQEYMRRLAKR